MDLTIIYYWHIQYVCRQACHVYENRYDIKTYAINRSSLRAFTGHCRLGMAANRMTFELCGARLKQRMLVVKRAFYPRRRTGSSLPWIVTGCLFRARAAARDVKATKCG